MWDSSGVLKILQAGPPQSWFIADIFYRRSLIVRNSGSRRWRAEQGSRRLLYGSACYVHSYAHQLNLIMQQATSHITKVRAFFSNLGGFIAFFSRSSKRTAVLDKVVAHRLPGASTTRGNFHSQAVNIIYEHKDDLLKFLQQVGF